MVAGKLLVRPTRPGVGWVSILLEGSMIAGRSSEGVCARTGKALSKTARENRQREPITAPPRAWESEMKEVMSVIQSVADGQKLLRQPNKTYRTSRGDRKAVPFSARMLNP